MSLDPHTPLRLGRHRTHTETLDRRSIRPRKVTWRAFWGGLLPAQQDEGRWAQPGSRGRCTCPSCAPGGLGQAPGLEKTLRMKAGVLSGTSDPDVGRPRERAAARPRSSDLRAAGAGTGFPTGNVLHPPHPMATVPVTVGSVRGSG